MKKLLFTLFLGMLFLSCSSDNSSDNSLSDTPIAKSTYDSSNFGIYKGIFVGSTGTILINIMNDGEISATLTIDGKSSIYTTTENVVLGSSILGLTFSNGSSSFDFNVDFDGSDFYISSINIVGHPDATIEIFKETSEHIVMCFVGTFKGSGYSGNLNLIISDGEVNGLAKNSINDITYLEGSEQNNTIDGHYDGGTFTGTIIGDKVNGTWQNDDMESGTWTGQRKL